MGQFPGNLTNTALADPNTGGIHWYGNAPDALRAWAGGQRNFQPSLTSTDASGAQSPLGPDQSKPAPSLVKPSLGEAASVGAFPGGANATSPGLTKAGKLVTLLTSGLQGALAGRAANEQATIASGGRRSGGAGMGFESGFTLPWQRAGLQQQYEQEQAKTNLLRAQADMVPTQFGPMPAALARYILPAQLRAGATVQAAETGAGAKVQSAQIANRFKAISGVGMFDTQTRQIIPGTEQGMAVTPEVAQDYGLPQEFIGRQMKLSDFASMERNALSAAPTVRTSTDPLGLTTTSTSRKLIPPQGGPTPQRPMVDLTGQGGAPRPRSNQRPAGGGSATGQSSLDSMAQQLVEGNMDPSQIPRRGAAYTIILQKANAYSQAKYGQPFDIAKASSDYAYAKSDQTQNTLKMINGMTEKGGAIDIASNAAKSLPQFDQQTINSIFNAAATQFGSTQATNFHTAMLGLADEYSKVMGGGISSDTGRGQALAILKDNYSRGQLAGAIETMRQDIAARKTALVGSNRYLMRQYGTNASPNGNDAVNQLIQKHAPTTAAPSR